MRTRLIARLLLCVLAGVVTTLGVAWLAAWIRPAPHQWSPPFAVDRAGESWMGFGERGLGWSQYTLYGASGLTDAGLTDAGLAMAQTLPRWVEPSARGDVDSRAAVIAGAGWPMIALRAECVGVGHNEPPAGGAWHTGLGPQWVEWGQWQHALAADVKASGATSPPQPSRQRVLPFGIAGSGLAVDVAFWSALWTLPLALAAGRRAVCKRRGRCPSCGYDLRGQLQDGCAECGWRRNDRTRANDQLPVVNRQ